MSLIIKMTCHANVENDGQIERLSLSLINYLSERESVLVLSPSKTTLDES